MSWAPVLLGLMLGLGTVLAAQGLRLLSKRDRAEADRRKGFWKVNLGLALVAISIAVFSRMAGR